MNPSEDVDVAPTWYSFVQYAVNHDFTVTSKATNIATALQVGMLESVQQASETVRGIAMRDAANELWALLDTESAVPEVARMILPSRGLGDKCVAAERLLSLAQLELTQVFLSKQMEAHCF